MWATISPHPLQSNAALSGRRQQRGKCLQLLRVPPPLAIAVHLPVLGSLLVVVATVVMEVAAVGAMPLGPMPHLWVAGAGAEAVVAVVVAQARHATAAEGWGISRQIAPTST